MSHVRGQPGNGLSKMVLATGGTHTRSLVTQAQRVGDWKVALLHGNGSKMLTPDAARELAEHLNTAAAECEQFQREDDA